MGAWGIKALERDEGLDVLDILKNEYVPEHPVMDLGEMIELMKEEVMLGSDFSQIDFLFDNTAMALAELYFQWKDNSKLDYDHEEAIWDKVTGFTASKEALAFLLRQLTDIKNEVPDEDGIREIVDLWKNEDSGEIAPAWLEHLNQLIDRLDSEQEARQMYIKKYWGNFIGGSDDSLNLVAFLEDQKKEARISDGYFLYLLTLPSEKILKRFRDNAIIYTVCVGIYCSRRLLTTRCDGGCHDLPEIGGTEMESKCSRLGRRKMGKNEKFRNAQSHADPDTEKRLCNAVPAAVAVHGLRRPDAK